MNQIDTAKKLGKLAWPGRAAALRRLGLIAAILLPCTWIVTALLIGNWNLLGDRNTEAFRHLREAATVFATVTCMVFLASLLPSLQRFFRWLFSRRMVRRELIVLAWMVTVVALFYGEEDWRGRRAWNKYSDALNAQGENLDFKAFIPQPIPDAENFAAIPEIQSWFVRSTNRSDTIWDTDAVERTTRSFSDVITSPHRMVDLVAWQRDFNAIATGRARDLRKDFDSDQLDLESRAKAASAILEALKPIEEKLEEFRAAAARPRSQYPLVYNLDNPWGILLPHLHFILAVCERLELRACAELAIGKTGPALDDVKLILRMSDSLNEEPFMISYMVRAETFRISTQPIWEGLAEHRWSDTQLKELQGMLERYDFIADMKRPLDCERSAGVLTGDLLARGRYHLYDLTSDPNVYGSGAANALRMIMPRGWYDLEKLSYCQLYDLQLKGAFDARERRVFPHQIDANTITVDLVLSGRNTAAAILTFHRFLAAILLPALENVPRKGAISQTMADEALIACGLERYRLAHGQFPASLEALSPDFISRLPHDVIMGTAYKYRLNSDGKFVLYSVGWNETDDGGQEASKNKPMSGDWVWQYP